MLIQAHGRPILRAILCGFAGVAPRSATQNLIELLSIVATKFPAETRTWMNDILFAVCVSCFLFLAVDDADTCTGRFCAVESDSRSEAGFCESYHRVCPRSSIFVDLLVLTMTMSRSRSPKKTREAAQQFTLVARGLEGTSFGYASVIV